MISQAPLDTTQAEFPPSKKSNRSTRYKLRSIASKILFRERVCHCGKKPVGAQASVVVGSDGGAYMAGLETCGSIWTCPVCAGKIAEGRRADVKAVVDGHLAAGGQIFMVTLTVPHKGFESVRQLRQGVASAWKKVLSGAPWVRRRGKFSMDYIRSLEVTHGRNGWHPHLHVLFFTNTMTDADQLDFETWLFDRWVRKAEKEGLGTPKSLGFSFEAVDHARMAADYVAKWGVDSEISKAHVKMSKKGGRSPWQILADAGEGDAASIMLFREYARAFKGARHLTWSKGLKDRYGVDSKTDEELAVIDQPFSGDTVIGTLRRGVWFRIVRAGAVPAVLDAAEDAGWPGVLSCLRKLKLALPERGPRHG